MKMSQKIKYNLENKQKKNFSVHFFNNKIRLNNLSKLKKRFNFYKNNL